MCPARCRQGVALRTPIWRCGRRRARGVVRRQVVPFEGVDPDPQQLRDYVRTKMRGSRTPDRVVFRDELPATATGKVLRRQLIDELAGTTTP
ncbi:long-chain fatty acid--CoA ligase [Mycobacterium simiae]|uniref:Long-chain fatty acid--CoA ligase n=1 Tax=Mycobacterium simiae TaxID=1784 RepID=A0A5B1BPL2_MYCSI|nr:long-chain fatty acid--CoA ligase [Mycobacterium simiae]